MGISYKGLFEKLNKMEISKGMLQNKLGISSATMAKLSKDEPVSIEIIEKICKLLNCQPGEVMSYENISNNVLLQTLKQEKAMHLKGGIYHQTQVKLAYNSNHIEGSTLTEEQTRYIYETNTIGIDNNQVTRVDDIIEAVNHFQCFDYMLDCTEELLSEGIIKKFHSILKTGTSDSRKDWFNVGDYKQKPNMVGDLKTTHPSKVKKEIQKLLYDYNSKGNVLLEDIIEFHWRFERIHPFQDGNGRVGRIIMFKECLKNNVIPFIIGEKHKFFYYRGLKEFENEKGFLMDTCLSAQDEYEKIVRYFID